MNWGTPHGYRYVAMFGSRGKTHVVWGGSGATMCGLRRWQEKFDLHDPTDDELCASCAKRTTHRLGQSARRAGVVLQRAMPQ